MEPIRDSISKQSIQSNHKYTEKSQNSINHSSRRFKLFVGGLSGDTTKSKNSYNKEHLFDYFGTFGVVQDCFVIKNSMANRSGGFGFVTMSSEETMKLVIRTQHWLRGALVDCKPALDKDNARAKEESEMKRKIFVGGLPQNLPDWELKEYFSKYGAVQKAYVVKDCKTGKTRGIFFYIKRLRICYF